MGNHGCAMLDLELAPEDSEDLQQAGSASTIKHYRTLDPGGRRAEPHERRPDAIFRRGPPGTPQDQLCDLVVDHRALAKRHHAAKRELLGVQREAENLRSKVPGWKVKVETRKDQERALLEAVAKNAARASARYPRNEQLRLQLAAASEHVAQAECFFRNASNDVARLDKERGGLVAKRGGLIRRIEGLRFPPNAPPVLSTESEDGLRSTIGRLREQIRRLDIDCNQDRIGMAARADGADRRVLGAHAGTQAHRKVWREAAVICGDIGREVEDLDAQLVEARLAKKELQDQIKDLDYEWERLVPSIPEKLNSQKRRERRNLGIRSPMSASKRHGVDFR